MAGKKPSWWWVLLGGIGSAVLAHFVFDAFSLSKKPPKLDSFENKKKSKCSSSVEEEFEDAALQAMNLTNLSNKLVSICT